MEPEAIITTPVNHVGAGAGACCAKAVPEAAKSQTNACPNRDSSGKLISIEEDHPPRRLARDCVPMLTRGVRCKPANRSVSTVNTQCRIRAVTRRSGFFESFNSLKRRYFFPGAPLAGAGGSVPPSARIFMFWSARINVAVFCALSFSRAASSASIELSNIRV